MSMSPHDRITSNSHTCFCEFVNARMPPGEGRGSHGDSERPPEKSTDAVTLAPRYASKKRGKGFGTKAPAAPERSFSLTVKEEGGEEERDQRAAVAVAETTPTATAPPAEGPPSAKGAAVEAGQGTPTAEGAAVKAGDEAGEEKDPTPPMPESFDAAVKAEATPTAEGQLEEVAAVKADTDTEKEEVLVEDVEIAAAAAKEAAALPTAEIPKRRKRRKRRRTQPRKSSSSHRDKRSPTPSPTNKRHGGGDGSPAPTPFEPCWKGSQSTSPSSARLPPQRRRRESSESDSSRGYRPAPAHRRPSSSPDGARSSTPRTPRQRSRSSRRPRTPSRSPQWKRKGHGQRDGKNKGKALSRGKGHRHGGLICQRCGQLVKGTGHPAGDKASMDAHMQNSSKCLAAAGLRPAKEKCQWCGKLLAHGDRWARQQHSWHCWQRWHQR